MPLDSGHYQQRKITVGPRAGQEGWYDSKTSQFMPSWWVPPETSTPATPEVREPRTLVGAPPTTGHKPLAPKPAAGYGSQKPAAPPPFHATPTPKPPEPTQSGSGGSHHQLKEMIRQEISDLLEPTEPAPPPPPPPPSKEALVKLDRARTAAQKELENPNHPMNRLADQIADVTVPDESGKPTTIRTVPASPTTTADDHHEMSKIHALAAESMASLGDYEGAINQDDASKYHKRAVQQKAAQPAPPPHQTHATQASTIEAVDESKAFLPKPSEEYQKQAVRRANNTAGREFELRLVPTSSIKPSQFGDDYDNDSSRHMADQMEDVRRGGKMKGKRSADFYPIVTDANGNIIDGNHRHAAHVRNKYDYIWAMIEKPPTAPSSSDISTAAPAPPPEQPSSRDDLVKLDRERTAEMRGAEGTKERFPGAANTTIQRKDVQTEDTGTHINVHLPTDREMDVPGQGMTKTVGPRAAVEASRDPNQITLTKVHADDELRGRGVPRELMAKVAHQAIKENLPLRTTGVFSGAGKQMMDKMVRDGYATKLGSDDYEVDRHKLIADYLIKLDRERTAQMRGAEGSHPTTTPAPKVQSQTAAKQAAKEVNSTEQGATAAQTSPLENMHPEKRAHMDRIQQAAHADLSDTNHPMVRYKSSIATWNMKGTPVRTIASPKMTWTDHEAMARMHTRTAAALHLMDKVAESKAQLDAATYHRNMAGKKKEAIARAVEKHAQQSKESHWRDHPTLKRLGHKLSMRDLHLPAVQKHLEELGKLEPALVQAAVNRGIGGVFVGGAGVPALDRMEHLRGVRPRGWSEGKTWDNVSGCYNHGNKAVIAGIGEGHSASVVLHEFGHSLGDIFGLNNTNALVAHHARLFKRLPNYLQQDGPGGKAGRQELLAEGFADVVMNRDRAVRIYDEEFVKWVEDATADIMDTHGADPNTVADDDVELDFQEPALPSDQHPLVKDTIDRLTNIIKKWVGESRKHRDLPEKVGSPVEGFLPDWTDRLLDEIEEVKQTGDIYKALELAKINQDVLRYGLAHGGGPDAADIIPTLEALAHGMGGQDWRPDEILPEDYYATPPKGTSKSARENLIRLDRERTAQMRELEEALDGMGKGVRDFHGMKVNTGGDGKGGREWYIHVDKKVLLTAKSAQDAAQKIMKVLDERKEKENAAAADRAGGGGGGAGGAGRVGGADSRAKDGAGQKESRGIEELEKHPEAQRINKAKEWLTSTGLKPLPRRSGTFDQGALIFKTRDEYEEQGKKTLAAAREAGLIIPESKFRRIIGPEQDGDNQIGGGEHRVYVDAENNRVLKITHGPSHDGMFGFSEDAYSYLDRLETSNRLWPSLGYKFEGVIDEYNRPLIATTMNFISGAHPEQEEIHDWFRSKGWVPAGEPDETTGDKRYLNWKDPVSGTVVSDTHQDNFLKTLGGLVPIDVVISKGNREEAQPAPPEVTEEGPTTRIGRVWHALFGKEVGKSASGKEFKTPYDSVAVKNVMSGVHLYSLSHGGTGGWYDDTMLTDIMHETDRANPPRVLPSSEVDTLVNEHGWTPMYRALDKPEQVEQFRTGKLYSGSGIYGNGTYVAKRRPWQGSESKALEEVRSYGPHRMRIAVPPHARVVSHDALAKKRASYYDELAKDVSSGKIDMNQYQRMLRVVADMGRFAALLNYDVIDASGTSGRGYCVILNRSMLAVQKENVQ